MESFEPSSQWKSGCTVRQAAFRNMRRLSIGLPRFLTAMKGGCWPDPCTTTGLIKVMEGLSANREMKLPD